MLGVGEKFPDFNVTATVSLEKGKEFKDITDKDYAAVSGRFTSSGPRISLSSARPRSRPSAR